MGLMERLASDIPALPLDIGRIIVGAVLFVYFFNTLRQARDFSDPDGLIDHSLLCRLFPPTRVSLFQPGMPGWLFRAVFVCACVAALMVVAGFHARAAGAFLFLAALSTLRWNVLASYLDDAMIHIFCLWIVLLPVGSTLNVPDLLAGTSGDLDTWLAATVPGAAPRAFIVNMALVYIVAGLYKFTSPMWRDGSAMHSALRMPIARAPGFWTLRWRTPLRLVTWAALILEPLFALIFVLPPASPLKWLLVAGALVFHLGIAFTLKIPYSNLAMLGAIPLALAPEIMQGWPGTPPLEGAVAGAAEPAAASPGPAGWIALTLVGLITDPGRLGSRQHRPPAPPTLLFERLGQPRARAALDVRHLPELPPLRLGRRAQPPRALRGHAGGGRPAGRPRRPLPPDHAPPPPPVVPCRQHLDAHEPGPTRTGPPRAPRPSRPPLRPHAP